MARLLAPRGRFALILPLQEGLAFKSLASEYGLYCAECWHVVPRAGKEPSRMLMLFSRLPIEESVKVLTLYSAENTRTDAFIGMVARNNFV